METRIILEKAINQFPSIKNLIGIENIISKAYIDYFSPIAYFLSRTVVDETKIQKLVDKFKENPNHIGVLIALDNALRPYHIMKHLDHCLDVIRNKKGLKVFIDHILQSDSFWQGYCEVEVASSLMKTFGSVELEPELPDGKYVDMMFPLNSENVFVEVTVPKQSYGYKDLMEESAKTGKVVELPSLVGRASDKILAELRHFSNTLSNVTSVIVLNLNESDFDDIDIEDALMGISKLVVFMDKITGKVIPKPVREPWTSFDADKDLARIGAIICYKREFALNGNIDYNKRIFGIYLSEEKCQLLSKLF